MLLNFYFIWGYDLHSSQQAVLGADHYSFIKVPGSESDLVICRILKKFDIEMLKSGGNIVSSMNLIIFIVIWIWSWNFSNPVLDHFNYRNPYMCSNMIGIQIRAPNNYRDSDLMMRRTRIRNKCWDMIHSNQTKIWIRTFAPTIRKRYDRDPNLV